MNNLFQLKYKFSIILLSFTSLFISGCEWFDSDGDKTDTTAPVITLTGANPQAIEIGSAYIELDATATDNKDGNITAFIVINASAVNTNTLGSYSVTYDVADSSGNVAATEIRTVDVVADLTPPVITLIGDNPQTIEVDTDYPELGASALDNMDGDITASIMIDDSAVDTSILGSYSVTYDVSDAEDNASETKTRTVNVVDTTPPVITLIGDSPQNIEIDAGYTELGATASDNVDGDISASIDIDSSAVDTSTAGSYSVTYDVSDASSNNAATVTRTVIVGEPQGNTFISANNGTSGVELFVTDGTADGTMIIKDIVPGSGASTPEQYLMIDEILYFSASNENYVRALWKSDGTADGTVMIKDNLSAIYLTNINGTLFFAGHDDRYGRELWKSDGTTDGTVMVKDIRLGTISSYLANFTVYDGTLFFSASDGIHGHELWKSDGTTDGTVMIKDIRTGAFSSSPYYLTSLNGEIFFSAGDGVNGNELWKTDGTADGTVMVKDIYPGIDNSRPLYLTNINGTISFRASDGVNGEELWETDGTADGTVMLKDIYPGADSSNPTSLINVGGTLYFRATDGVDGHELWKSGGTADDTVIVKDIAPGTDSFPQEFVNVNGTLFFRAHDGTTGREDRKSVV